jgi:hypothetical protein
MRTETEAGFLTSMAAISGFEKELARVSSGPR